MISDIRDLYQSVILDHSKRPRNFGALAEAEHAAEGHNPLCGDRVGVSLSLDGGRVSEVRFEGSGCAISIASASLMTEAVKGRSLAEVEDLFAGFHGLVTSDLDAPADPRLGKLAVFAGVREYPVRVKCATLPWHTLHAALRNSSTPVTTED